MELARLQKDIVTNMRYENDLRKLHEYEKDIEGQRKPFRTTKGY